MSTTIMDGQGGNKRAGVTDTNRLKTQAITVTELTAATEEADSFVAASDFVTLTSTGSFSGVFFFKNTTEDKDFHIDSLRTCNDSFCYYKIYRNVTAGTLVSSGTAGSFVNGSFGSNDVPSATVLSGADSLTATDGELLGTHMQGAGHSTQEWKGGVDLTPGTSMAILVKPSTNPTEVCIQLVGFVKPTGVV